MFVNEYVMDRKHYDKWATPKFWKLPLFYVYCFIFVVGVFGWFYFDRAGLDVTFDTKWREKSPRFLGDFSLCLHQFF